VIVPETTLYLAILLMFVWGKRGCSVSPNNNKEGDRTMKMLDAISDRLGKVCGYFSGVFIFIVMLMVAIDVFLRKVFNSPIRGGYELISLVMVVIVFFAITYTQSSNSAVHVMLILSRMKGRFRLLIWAIGLLATTATAVLFAYGSYVHAGLLRMIGITTSVILIPYWPFYYLGAFTFLLYSVVLFLHTFKSFVGVFNARIAEEVTSNWVE